MDLSSLNLNCINQGPLNSKIRPFRQRNSLAERPYFYNSGKVGILRGDERGVLEIRVSKLKCYGCRSLVVRSMGKDNHENSSSSENSDQPIPEGDGSSSSNPSFDSCKSEDATSQKSNHSISDWRAFRANLVSQKQVYLLDADTPIKDAISRKSSNPLGLKWAHPISVPETGCVLIATEKLDGVRTFERTVVLLLRSGTRDPREGPFGVVINRPIQNKIKHKNSSNLSLAPTFADSSLHFGGPLDVNMFLLKTEDHHLPCPSFEQVLPGLCFGRRNSFDEAVGLVKKGVLKPQDFKFFFGYAGWQLDQLREEIESDYWFVAACSANLISGDSSSGLWEEILQLMGGHYSELSRRPKQDRS
ncbi:uncharacterized protein LOC143858142 [Tasmannia lanceolata]|uniref:uncharacterized protein LOC143858142 n=1 Tax=Tasmannia lanceolata TaxID=3420 RepID=UPI0040643352